MSALRGTLTGASALKRASNISITKEVRGNGPDLEAKASVQCRSRKATQKGVLAGLDAMLSEQTSEQVALLPKAARLSGEP